MADDLGPQRDWIDPQYHENCGYNPTPETSPVGDCGKPSTTHIQLRGDDGYLAACGEHLPFALAHMPVLEWHTWGVWCSLPGALWYPSPTPDETDSYCALDDSGESPVRAGTAELVAHG